MGASREAQVVLQGKYHPLHFSLPKINLTPLMDLSRCFRFSISFPTTARVSISLTPLPLPSPTPSPLKPKRPPPTKPLPGIPIILLQTRKRITIPQKRPKQRYPPGNGKSHAHPLLSLPVSQSLQHGLAVLAVFVEFYAFGGVEVWGVFFAAGEGGEAMGAGGGQGEGRWRGEGVTVLDSFFGWGDFGVVVWLLVMLGGW